MMTLQRLVLAVGLGVGTLLATACGGGGDAPRDAAAPGDGGVDAAPDAACFDDPQTHEEIINACTTAQKIFKNTTPPLLGADGALPALPN